MLESKQNFANILVVDDKEENLLVVQRTLRRTQHNIISANSGQIAIEHVKETEFAVVLMDVEMPQMDGFETVSVIRDMDMGKNLPVIFLTAHEMGTSIEERGYELGAIDFLYKPFVPKILAAKVQFFVDLHLHKKQLERQNVQLNQQKSELEKLKAELLRSNQELQQFSSAASHDLLEPLRKVMTFGNFLEKKYFETLPEEGQGYVKRMIKASSRMQELLVTLLEYSRFQTKKVKYKKVSLKKAVDQAIENLETSIKENNANVNIAQNLPEIIGDEIQLTRVVQNLVANAIKYRKKETSPVIHINHKQQAENRWDIIVKDNGIGFNPKYSEKIFHPFQQLQGKSAGGVGMGLAICARIIEQHEGKIVAHSQEGEGSTFTINLPGVIALADLQ